MLFSIDRSLKTSIQQQLRTKIVSSVIDGQLVPGALLPSTRALSKQLGVSRTTVVIVYESLVEDGFLIAADRSGFKINPDYPADLPSSVSEESETASLNWFSRFAKRPGKQANISKPADWQSYPYPFVYGQPDPALFPLPAWRECSRQAMSELAMRDWASDAIAQDDPLLVHEIKTKLLPRRGVFVSEDNILITAGAQNALYLIAAQLVEKGQKVGMEEPGYPDARNIFDLSGAEIEPLPLDQDGAVYTEGAARCSFLFVTPGHNSPTTISMTERRRKEFLLQASRFDQILIEDDYECEAGYLDRPLPALKSTDTEGRVIYVGSLSKSIFPGLRLGYIVGDRQLIDELRALRRLMMRHAPSNNQRTTSLFISQGHHDTYIRKLNRIYRARRTVMIDALDEFLPGMRQGSNFGGTSFWLKGPEGIDSRHLARDALKNGIVIEPGYPHFLDPRKQLNYFRLGFSSIPDKKIPEGIRKLAGLL